MARTLFYWRSHQMQLCYIDESGTPESTGNTSHFVLAGLSIPDEFWRFHLTQLETIKSKYDLQEAEIHVAWMAQRYRDQESVPGFNSMTFADRRNTVGIQRTRKVKKLKQNLNGKSRKTLRFFRRTNDYIHLTLQERRQVITEIAKLISSWDDVRLFAECIDKGFFDPARSRRTIEEQAFEQIVSRFEHFLKANHPRDPHYGLIIHDNNQSVAEKHSKLMKTFLSDGTLWTHIDYVIETPMFVDSELTYMVQMADLCAYAIRRYIENSESQLFNLVFQRAQKRGNRTVSVRHFTKNSCTCTICRSH